MCEINNKKNLLILKPKSKKLKWFRTNFQNDKTPNSSNIRAATQNLGFHINYFDYLLKNQDYLVTNNLTYLDFLASANLSILDYLGLLSFEDNNNIKDWYFKLKSRPSFKTLLKDQIVGLNPDEKYKFVDM